MKAWSHEPGSFWLDRDAVPFRPPLPGDAQTEVAVVGAGIAGAFVALALAEAGMRVLVLEAHRAGRGASGRNAGFLLAEAAETWAEVARTHGEAVAAALRGAGLSTRAAVDRVAAGADVGLRWGGSLRLSSDADEARDFGATAARLGPPLRLLEADALPAAYRGRGFSAGLLDPGDGEVDPLRLLFATLSAAEARGARIHEETRVARIREQPGGVLLEGPRGRVEARRAVVTTNAWLADLVHPRPVLRPVRAQMLAARVDPAPEWDRPVYANRGGDYWRRLPDGTLLVGGCRRAGGPLEETDDARAEGPVQPALDRLLASLLPEGARPQVVARWAGTMAFTGDGVPAAGRVPGRERVFVLAGCNGHGMGWAPGLATSLADVVLGRAATGLGALGAGLPPAFDPARPALSPAPVPGARGEG